MKANKSNTKTVGLRLSKYFVIFSVIGVLFFILFTCFEVRFLGFSDVLPAKNVNEVLQVDTLHNYRYLMLVAPGIISLLFTVFLYYVSEKRHAESIRNSLFDDHWYRKVVHEQCYKYLIDEVDKNHRECLGKQPITKMMQDITSLKGIIKVRMTIAETMIKDTDISLKIDEILMSLEDAVATYFASVEHDESIEEKEASIPEDILSKSIGSVIALATSEFFDFHKKLIELNTK